MITTVLTTEGIVVERNFNVLPLSDHMSQKTILSSIIPAMIPQRIASITKFIEMVIKSQTIFE
jgi:hypothetical protein